MARRGSGFADATALARRLASDVAARVRSAVASGRMAVSRRGGGVVRLDDVRRRLELLVTAVYDRPIPITVADPPKRRRWPRWASMPGPRALGGTNVLPSTDGERIQLPREISAHDSEAAFAAYRLMAIEQAERMARGTPAALLEAATPVERDLYLLSESVAVDAAISRSVPGLRSALTAARAQALSQRPSLGALTAAERAVEQMLRGALSTDPSGEDPQTGTLGTSGTPGGSVAATPRQSLAWARETASDLGAVGGRYRGVAPVAAWGTVNPSPSGRSDAPHKQVDSTPTLRGGERGFGRFGRGKSEGGKQGSQAGVEQGRSDDPRRGERQPTADASGNMPMAGGRDAPADATLMAEATDGADEGTAALGSRTMEEAGTREEPQPQRRRARSRLPGPKAVVDGVEYPEWDWQTGDYRANGAIVRVREPDLSDDSWGTQVLARYGPLVRHLRERFERLRSRRARLNHQRDGDELDLSACVRALVDRHTGHTVDDRLYVAVRPARRGLAIMLLIDISGSTDEWIDGRRRVIDVEKVALLLASEALDALGDLYAVLTFSGKGRASVRMRTIKDFTETNGHLVRRRIAALEPEGYTRAGAAIRHAAALLERQPAAHRLLLIISDGKPNDVDEYEGLSGVEDTRQAIIETRARGVYPFCLTIDRQGQEYLGRIFGEAGHTVLRNPRQLPLALVKVVKHLLAS